MGFAHEYSARRTSPLACGVVGSEAIRIDQTKFWEYRDPEVWEAVRDYV